MKTVAIIQARMSSSRLPGKVLMDLGGMPVLSWCVRAARAIIGVDAVVVATSDEPGDDPVAAWCGQDNVDCVRGPLQDVLARYVLAAQQSKADIVMRLTADCPLHDPVVCGEVVQLRNRTHADYASNVGERTWPQGLDCEIFTMDALLRAASEAKLPAEREHVTPYIRNHPERFKAENLLCPLPGIERERWTLDTPQDYAFLVEVGKHLPDRPPRYTEVLEVLKRHPELENKNPPH